MPCFKWHILLHSKHSKQAGWTQWETSIFVQAPFEVQTIITWRRQTEPILIHRVGGKKYWDWQNV